MVKTLEVEKFENIKRLVKDGYVRESKHPKFEELSIFTYTPKAEFEEIWNDKVEARICRGLVLNTQTREIIIPCVEKFFNYDSPFAPRLSFENSEITLKEDGYLIQITYDKRYGLIVTSKGSFTSQYVEFVRNWIEMFSNFYDENKIYICELLHDFPGDEGTIVTKHSITRLVCWAVIDKLTLKECEDKPYSNLPMPLDNVKIFTPDEAKEYLTQEVEGVVLHNKTTGERVKMKTQWFFKMHKLISNCTKRQVYEILKEGKRVQDIDIPDEFMKQMIDWQDEILEFYERIKENALTYMETTSTWTNKMIGENAGSAIPKLYASLLFAKRAGKEDVFNELIWKFIKTKIKENNE